MNEPVLLSGHSDSVYDVAWAPDGNRLASASKDGMLRIWGTEGSRDAEFDFGEPVRAVSFSHDGQLLAVGTYAGVVQVRETSSWKIIFTRKCELIKSLLFLRQSRMLLAGGSHGVQGWPLDGGLEVQYRTEQPVFSIRPSPNQEWLAVACRGRVVFLHRRLDTDPLAVWDPGDSVDVNDCAIAPDGETCAAALRLRDGGSIGRTEHPDLFEIQLWRPRLGEEPQAEESLVGHISWVTSVDFSPDSRLLASASFDSSVRLWNYIQLRQVAEVRGHGGAVYVVRFSPQSDRLATCSADSTIRIWSLEPLSDHLPEQRLVLRCTSVPRGDGVGIDLVVMNAEMLADQLVAIESQKRLHEIIAKTVQMTDRELGLALQQIGNVRAEQARREGDLERVRRWRVVQSEVQMQGFNQALAQILVRRSSVRDSSEPAIMKQLSTFGEPELQRIHDVAGYYTRTILAIAQAELSAEEGRYRLADTQLDPLAVFVAAAMLQSEIAKVRAVGKSLKGLEQAVEVLALLLPASVDPVIAATLFEMTGMLHCFTGDNYGGASWLERGAVAAQQGECPQQFSSILGNLGNALANIGQVKAAKAAYEESVEIALHEGLFDEFITHSSNLADLLANLGEYSSAFPHLCRAASVCKYMFTKEQESAGQASTSELVKIVGRYSECLNKLARVYHGFNDDEGEAQSYAEAYDIAKAINNRPLMGRCLGNLADVDRRAGRTERAEERYQGSYAIAKKISDFNGQIHVLGGQALMRESAGHRAEARALRGRAIRIARKHGLRERLVVELCNVASAAQERGRYAETEAALCEAQVAASELRLDDGATSQKHVAYIADALIRLYVRSGRPTEALEAAERARAGVLLHHIAGTQHSKAGMYSAREILGATRRVGRHAVLISYHVMLDRVCTFVLRAQEAKPHAVESTVSRSELAAIRRDFERQVARRFARNEKEETWLRLGRVTIDPILPYLRDGDFLIVAPHGAIHGLPLHALMADGARLINRWPIAYVPSASAVVPMAARQLSAVRTCSVLGAHFTDEAKRVAELLGVRAVVGAQLDKNYVLRTLAESDVVHLSTHGFYIPDDPRRSGLVLHPTSDTDAYLRLLSRPQSTTWMGLRRELDEARTEIKANVLDTDDLVSANSNARLITMSACETGLVRTNATDDPVGLVPSLLAIGVHAVIATLWLVDAKVTAELMHELYSALMRPDGWSHIPNALRDAVSIVYKRHPHPYHWAPLLLAGGIGEATAE